ncbi:MAG: SGNH/GDSL hydrolase family protein [Anaerolinea sp.]|nr:SGNH/GDSL hydrolase family protein [Anaerolinea sp.]
MIKRIVSPLIRALRRRPVIYWWVILLYFTVGLGAWMAGFQPTNGRWLTPLELILLALWIVGLLVLLTFDFDTEQARRIAARLGKSKWTGVLITLTTIAILFFAAETYMRIFYVTTDGYGFTAMNYHWYQNFYWGHYNSVGYRDYEPQTGEGITHVAVLGDSFAMGHGINDIDATFPQLLEHELGQGYDVNVIAQSGWDTDIELYQLQQYPIKPDIVILSYYLNDIDYLLQAPELNPDSRFDFPDNPALSWFILNYFVPNYIYYNLLQFTSVDRNSNFLLDLVNAHTNESYWSEQAQRLYEIKVWADQNNVRLIMLLWPHITAVDASAPAVRQVGNFMRQQGVTVVDMSEPIKANPSAGLIVNRFDTHPGVVAQRLAADALYAAIQAEPE